MSKHTPGPWNWQGPISRNLANYLDGSGCPVLRCIDISEADARLIAAAPDLLDALKRLIATGLGQREHHEFMSNPAHYARAAIAKATGEQA